MNHAANKNKQSWNKGASAYSNLIHSEIFMERVIEKPSNAFHHTTWELIQNECHS